MPKRLDIPDGTRYGRLVVIKEVEPRKAFRGYARMFLCRCDCGKEIVTALSHLRFGSSTSCGCKQRESASMLASKKRICPDTPDGKRLHSIWSGMKRRCYSKSCPSYKRYGARGISVCDEWRNGFLVFYEWSISNGYKDGLTIDRIDNNGNYEPTNCRWSTPKEQANNTKKNILITHNGETHTVSEWSRLTGIRRTTIQLRLNRGCPDEMLFSPPIHGGARKKGEFYGRKQ